MTGSSRTCSWPVELGAVRGGCLLVSWVEPFRHKRSRPSCLKRAVRGVLSVCRAALSRRGRAPEVSTPGALTLSHSTLLGDGLQAPLEHSGYCRLSVFSTASLSFAIASMRGCHTAHAQQKHDGQYERVSGCRIYLDALLSCINEWKHHIWWKPLSMSEAM